MRDAGKRLAGAVERLERRTVVERGDFSAFLDVRQQPVFHERSVDR